MDGEIYLSDGLLISLALYDASSPGLLDAARAKSDIRCELTVIGKNWGGETIKEVLRICEEVYAKPPTAFIYSNKRFDEFKAEGRISPEPPSGEEKAAIELLCRKEIRSLAIAIKTSGGLLIRDINKQLPSVDKDQISKLISELKVAKLIDSEIVVVCMKSQAQMARVPSLNVVQEMGKYGVRCACGKPITEERIEEAITVTDMARSLIDKARWMTEILVERLGEVGVPRSSILVEQNLGGDEIDCLANISGELVLFELKDKEFSLGNAYSFGAKISIVKPQHRVIVTTEYVGTDAKDHFNRAQQAEGNSQTFLSGREAISKIQYIEGINELKSGLELLTGKIYRQDAARLMDRILPLLSVDSGELIKAFEAKVQSIELKATTPENPVPENAAVEPDPIP